MKVQNAFWMDCSKGWKINTMKRLLSLILSLLVVIAMFAGCANSANGEVDAPNTELTDDTAITTTTPEITTETTTTAPEVTTTEPTTTEAATTTTEATTEVTTTTEATTTTAQTTTVTTVRIEDMSGYMYVKASVNVRSGPGVSYDRIGHLDLGEEVKITGKAENGWYRIEFEDGEYFASGSYLTSEKPKAETTVSEPVETVPEIKEKSAKELVLDLKIGWNLGNTLDAPNGENSWGQPTTTEAMMIKLKELGFNTIRIPVSWHKHVSGNNYTIDKAWLDRVQEVVDYAYDNGLYVIINSHHDNDMYYPSTSNFTNAKKYIQSVWSQVSERFKDYDQHLIFEPMNEPRLAGTNNEWWFDENSHVCRDAAKYLNEFNQIFVDTVRSSGGYNSERFLMVTPYSASAYNALNQYFKMPTDTANDKLILSVHAYTPYDLVMGDGMNKVTFGRSEQNQINDFVDKLYEKYVKNGIPVIVGETGCINKNNPDARYQWAYYFVTKTKKSGMTIIVWDNGSDSIGTESYAFFDRKKLKIFDNTLPVYNGFMDALNDLS